MFWAADFWAPGVWAAAVWADIEIGPVAPADPAESPTSGQILDAQPRRGMLGAALLSGVLADDGLTFGEVRASCLVGSLVPVESHTGAITQAQLAGTLLDTETRRGKASPETPLVGRLERDYA
jgi:hypothetical protein